MKFFLECWCSERRNGLEKGSGSLDSVLGVLLGRVCVNVRGCECVRV